MIEITAFDRVEQTVTFETENGKIIVTFEDWKRIVDAYIEWDVERPLHEGEIMLKTTRGKPYTED